MERMASFMQVYLISFSPTGGTRRVLDLLAEGMEMEPAVVELCSQDAVQQIAFEPDDICLVGAPVYGGRGTCDGKPKAERAVRRRGR